MTASTGALPAATRPTRVTLRVGSLAPLVSFYEELVGLTAVRRADDEVALAAAPDGDPLLVLREDEAAPARSPSAAGLFHVALLFPDRGALGDALVRLRDAGYRLEGASDHLVSEALYLSDPEGNGVELYRDRPREEWSYDDGRVVMDTLPLDLDALAADARGADSPPAETSVGHVHLEVTDLDRSERFYRTVGFRVQSRWTGARFLAAGGYHHHLGLNTWRGRRDPVGDGRGLVGYALAVPTGAQDDLAARLRAAGIDFEYDERGLRVADPDGIEIRVVADGA